MFSYMYIRMYACMYICKCICTLLSQVKGKEYVDILYIILVLFMTGV